MPAFFSGISASTVLALAGIIFLLCLLAIVRRGRLHSRQLEDLPARLHPVDVDAFRNLVDPAEQSYLRAHLTKGFAALHRLRMRAASRYVLSVFHNARLLLHVGVEASRNSDPQVAEAGRRLVDSALRLRWYALLALIRLYAGMALPGLQLSPTALADLYQQLNTAFLHLGRVRYPARGAGVSATY